MMKFQEGSKQKKKEVENWTSLVRCGTKLGDKLEFRLLLCPFWPIRTPIDVKIDGFKFLKVLFV